MRPDTVPLQLCRRELRFGKHIQHQYILPFLGVAETASYTAIITPLISNGNMLDYIRAHPAANRHFLVVQVAEALAYLHDTAGIVHGDLKCENVLVSEQGSALLADFGLYTLAEKSEADVFAARFYQAARGPVRTCVNMDT